MLELSVRGAGSTFVYRFTLIKTRTTIASMKYRYNTSTEADEVVISKNVDWDQLMAGEAGVKSGVKLYVPEDAASVAIEMRRAVNIYGPAGDTVVTGGELDNFSAANKVTFCPKTGHCSKQEGAHRIKNLEGATSIPVLLNPDGHDPDRFLVTVVRVSDRLIELDLDEMEEKRGIAGWSKLEEFPSFDPLKTEYQAFFNVPEGDSLGSDKWATTFFRVTPQGDSYMNWVEVELEAQDPGMKLDTFCQHAGGGSELLDPTSEMLDEELLCEPSSAEMAKLASGNGTEELMMRVNNNMVTYRGHFYVRAKYRLSDPKPFTVRMRVMRHVRGALEPLSEPHVYEVRAFPQITESFQIFTDVPGPKSFRPPPAEALLQLFESGGGLSAGLQSSAPAPAPARAAGELTVPIFLSPPFHARTLNYTAVLPLSLAGALDVRLTDSRSFWAASSGDKKPSELESAGLDTVVHQLVDLRRRGHGQCVAPGPGELCPLNVRVYQRSPGYPRTYTVSFAEAKSDQVMFVGMRVGTGLSPLPGFRPDVRRMSTSLGELPFKWVYPAPAPAPAASAPASAEPAEEPAGIALAQVPRDGAVPSGSLWVLATSAEQVVGARWNDAALAALREGGQWWRFEIPGPALAEACWCNRQHIVTGCKVRLEEQAPRLTARHLRPNSCSMQVLVDDRVAYDVLIGLALDQAPRLEASELEEAFRSESEVRKTVPALAALASGDGAIRRARVSPHVAAA